jgi:RNA ligase (TIGR02306 family)
MSTFTVAVVRVDAIDVIEGADRIEAARVLGYRIVVPKGACRPGDLAVYIPEAGVVPENVLVDLGLVGKLAGPQHNRVKAMRLRGVVSQGLLYRPPFAISLGEDLAENLRSSSTNRRSRST